MFRQFVSAVTGQVDPGFIVFTDENGQVWTVPQGHRIWTEIYQPWLAAGNTPTPAV